MIKVFVPFIATILLISCNDSINDKVALQARDSIRQDIPKLRGKLSSLYTGTLSIRDFLGGLDTLEYGYDSLQIRFWYEADSARKIVVIKKNKQWIAQCYTYEIAYQNQDSIYLEKLEMKRLFPKIEFTKFVDSLVALDILNLPDQESIPNLSIYNNSATINVEVATKNSYRFYSYSNPKKLSEEFAEAKKIVKIIELIRDELGINTDLLDKTGW